MISDPALAKAVLDQLFDVSGGLDWSVQTIVNKVPDGELASYRRAIGKVMAELWDQVLQPILITHPDLTPEHLRKGGAPWFGRSC
jgi:hypothetical protein